MSESIPPEEEGPLTVCLRMNSRDLLLWGGARALLLPSRITWDDEDEEDGGAQALHSIAMQKQQGVRRSE